MKLLDNIRSCWTKAILKYQHLKYSVIDLMKFCTMNTYSIIKVIVINRSLSIHIPITTMVREYLSRIEYVVIFSS